MRFRRTAIPCGILLRTFQGKQLVGNTYMKLLLGLPKTSTAMLPFSNLSLRLFFSFCLFKSLNKFMVIPQTLKKFYGTGTYIENKVFISYSKLFLIGFEVFLTIFRQTSYYNDTYVLIVTIHYHCLGIVFTLKIILI